MLKKLWNKKNDKKGFTLVELIVVLIILAILAALLIPALTGYIDKAKNKQIVAETRMAVMAAQTLVDEEYAKGTDPLIAPSVTDIQELGEITGDITLESDDITDGKITTMTYERAGKTCVYTAGDTSGTDGAYDVQ